MADALLVDDDVSFQAALAELVRAEGFSVETAASLGEARTYLSEHTPDLALVDPRESWTVRARESASTQGYTPFEGIELGARVKATFLRGALVCENGNPVGKPRGRYLHRPTA